MDTNKKEDFSSAVWNRVEELIREKKIKQSQLVLKCMENGMPITQPELSKLYNGTKKINLYELAAISKAIDVPADFFISAFIPYQDNLLNGKESKNC